MMFYGHNQNEELIFTYNNQFGEEIELLDRILKIFGYMFFILLLKRPTAIIIPRLA